MQVLFIGCGQIGGSLLLRARERLPQATLWVHDQPEARAAIVASGACDRWIAEPFAAAADASVVVIATPLALAAQTLVKALDRLNPRGLVLDVMSLKRPLHAAVAGHPREGRFVGGHPMFGSESSGFSAANPAWVEDAPFILTHSERTAQDAVLMARDLVTALGARPIERDPLTHDRELARVSHLPQAISSLLMALAGEDEDALEVHGPGFRDMTRLALSAPAFWAEVFAGNADILRLLLERFADDVHAFARHIEHARETLERARDAKWRVPRLEQGTLASRVAESSTGRMLRRVQGLIERGEPVIGMHVGEPKLPPSAEVEALVREALGRAAIVYTPTHGARELRERVSEVASPVLEREVSPAETIVTVGAKQALHLALASLLAPGDEVIVISPAWVSFTETVRLAGGRPVLCGTSAGFVPDPEHIAAAVGPHTRAIIINSPNNPTGVVYDRARLEAVLAPCLRAGVWLISDELYRTLVFEGQHISAASLYDPERSAWLDGLSKSHAMTGLRIGYAVGPRTLVDKMAKLASHETSCASSVSQSAAAALLAAHPNGDPGLLREVSARRARVAAWAARFDLDRPLLGAPLMGGFYAWLDATAIDESITGRMLSEQLLEKTQVATMPGEAFGAPGFVRLSYALSAEMLEDALGRLEGYFRLPLRSVF